MYTPIQFYDDKPKSSFPMREPKLNARKEDLEKKGATTSKSVEKSTSSVETYKLNLSSMVNKGSEISVSLPTTEPKKSSGGTRKKKNSEFEVSMAGSSEENKSSRQLNDFETNTPYMDKYEETNAILRSSIAQIEYGLGELQKDADKIRNSNHRKKYDYLSLIHGTMGNYLSNKISAARELNNTINKCNEMEYKRFKELKLMAGEQDDDKAVLESYRAFVNMPVGAYNMPALGPSSQDLTINSGNIRGVEIGGDAGYENYIRNMTPQQHMMALEGNPDIKEVVMYEQRTGRRWFEVINIRTGEVIPNSDKTDMMLIDEFELDLNKKIARSINMGISMPLIVLEDPTLKEY